MNKLKSRYKISNENIEPWKILLIYHAYRFFLSCILIIFNFTETARIWVGKPDLRLYLYTTILYMVVNIIFTILNQFKKPSFNLLAMLSFIVEIGITMILVHASGGSLSWISFLLIIPVAMACITLPGLASYLLTGFSVAGLLAENLINSNFNYNDIGFPFVSTLGTILVVLSLVTNMISRRAKFSEALAEKRGAELATMEQLNAHIVSAIRIGILIIDNNNEIRLINSAARYMIGLNTSDYPKNLNQLPLTFQAAYNRQKLKPEESIPFLTSKDSVEIRIILKNLSENLLGGTLVFIHDVAKERQRAEILKLKSLDHLAANIAHEIRNPLNAISHASQLLSESNEIDTNDNKLLQIITAHCARVNNIIQSIQFLSKRNPTNPVKLKVEEELENVIREISYNRSNQQNSKNASKLNEELSNSIEINCLPKDLTVEFDKGQFNQVLINLCDNGIRYSEKATGKPSLKITGTHYAELHETHIDIIDKGPGPQEAEIPFLFDPFYTTETTGSGLGLYISKELCQSNGARLNYVRQENGACSFRVIIPDGAGDLANE